MATWWNLLRGGIVADGLQEVLVEYRVGIPSLSSNKWVSNKRLWRLYRKQEKLGRMKAIYYQTLHNIKAIKKRI